MAIGEQFSGLDMKNLIGAPLGAAADASVQLAHSTADFINTVGFDKDGKTRTAAFKFNQMGKNEDGTLENQEMCVDVPLLAIVPIPNLQIDEVNILFDMEVKQSEMSESSSDYSGSFSGRANFGLFKATVSGSVSSHSTNTRSSDNSAKYHVDVSATNHGTPEGLARVLDMMAANVAPTIAGSTTVDESGKALTGERKSRNEEMKRLRLKKSNLETAYNAAMKSFNTTLALFKREASNVQNNLALTIQNAIDKQNDVVDDLHTKKNPSDEDKTKTTEAEKLLKDYMDIEKEVSACWTDIQNTASDKIGIAASDEKDKTILEVFVLKGAVVSGSDKEEKLERKTYDKSTDAPITTLSASFDKAIKQYKDANEAKKQLDDAEVEYNNALYKVSTL